MKRLVLCGLAAAAVALVPDSASAYSVRVHIHLANEIRSEILANWTATDCDDDEPWCGEPAIRLLGPDGEPQEFVLLKEKDAEAIVDFPELWRGGSIGPDNTVFPGMTEPSHSPDYEPFRQCLAMYDLAENGGERAYALGCLLHGVTDNNAHHLVNYMSGETFTLYPKDAASGMELAFSLTNVVRHATAEGKIEEALIEARPDAFSEDQMRHAIAKDLFRRVYLDPDEGRGLWHVLAGELVEKKNQALRDAGIEGFDPDEHLEKPVEELMESGSAIELDGRIMEAYFEFLTSGELGPADYVLLLPEMVEDIKRLLDLADGWGTMRMAELTAERAERGQCKFLCPILYLKHGVYEHIFAPRNGGPSRFRQAVDLKNEELDFILVGYLDTVERLSNQIVIKGLTKMSLTDLSFAFEPLSDSISQVTDFPYHLFFPRWAVRILSGFTPLREFLEGTYLCITREFQEQIKERARMYIAELRDQLLAQFPQARAFVDDKIAQLRERAGVSTDSPDVLTHEFHRSVAYMNSYNSIAGALANPEVVFDGSSEGFFAGGPVSFDASFQVGYNQLSLCEGLREAFYPCGMTAAEMLQPDYRDCAPLADASGDHEPPVECHAGDPAVFVDSPAPEDCVRADLEGFLDGEGESVGSYSLAFPPALADGGPQCFFPLVPGVEVAGGKFDDADGDDDADEAGCSCRAADTGGWSVGLPWLLIAAGGLRRRRSGRS